MAADTLQNHEWTTESAVKETAPPRRYLAPNVIALWPEDRPPVVNPARRGRYPRGVYPLRRWDRLRPGVYAYLWNNCLPENRGVVVQLLRRASHPGMPGFWEVRGVTALLAKSSLEHRQAEPERCAETCAEDLNLRRCPAPKGAQKGV